MPQRDYHVESTKLRKDGRPRGKGYRIVPDLDPRMSAVEKALNRAGFDCYMPAEKRLIRDRRKPDLWKSRRFALMVGYVFVHDPWSFVELEATPGVIGIVGSAGRPLAIDILDILALRTMEAKAEVEFDAQSREARRQLRKKAKDDPYLKKIVDKLDMAGTLSMPLGSELLAS